MLPSLTILKKTALDLLFPCRCVGCGKEGDFICACCEGNLPRIIPPVCPVCGAAKPIDRPCTSCPGHWAMLDGIRAPFFFEGIIRSSVHRLKYNNLRAIAIPLAKLMADFIAANPLPYDIIIPVPLHRKRLRERGYNQSELLAKELAELTGIPVETKCLTRLIHTPAQAMTNSVAERRSNIRGAFECKNCRAEGKSVLLVDDVATSGATLDSCAAALKSAGAVSVWGLTLARDIC